MVAPLIVANFSSLVGGGEVGLVELVEGLRRIGHRPIVTVPGEGDLAKRVDARVIPRSIPGAAAAIERLAQEADLVHATGPRGLVASWMARTGKPLIWHVRVAGRDKIDPGLKRIPDLIIANSRATAERFAGSSRVRVVYNGVKRPTPAETTLGLPTGRRHVAVIGRMTPEKGHEDLLPAVEEIIGAREDVGFVFIGDDRGPVGEKVRALRDRHPGRVTATGFIEHAADHLPEFDLVVVPSRVEGFGRVAAEALRAGVPVLARRVGGLVEVLGALRDPFLPASTASWAGRILAELESPAHTREELVTAGDRFDLFRHVDEVVAVYLELLSPAATPS